MPQSDMPRKIFGRPETWTQIFRMQ